LALFEIASFSALANVLVAARKLATDPDPLNRIKAMADLAKDGKALTAAIKGAGLSPLAAEMAKRAAALDRHLTHEGWAKEDAKAIFWQVAPLALADPTRLAATSLDPEAATEAMVAAIHASGHARDFRQTAYAESYFRKVVSGTLAVMVADTAFVNSITPALWRETLTRQGIVLELTRAVKEDTAEILLLVRELHAIKKTTVPEETLIALARKIQPRVENKDEALRELERATDIAADTIARGEAGSNLDSFVDQVLRQVGALTGEGRLDDAAKLALARLAEAKAGVAQIRATAIDALLLNGEATAAAALIAERVEEDMPDPAARFDALRTEQETWYVRGQDQGLRLDLEVAIALARGIVTRASGTGQRVAALNDLGLALYALGSREAGTLLLDEAETTHRAAVAELSAVLPPQVWATTQMNLGNTLATLGTIDAGTDRLVQGVATLKAALGHLSRDDTPEDWALCWLNLGAALQTLGDREANISRLSEAVAAFETALEVLDRQTNARPWATAQMNLGTALQSLAAREGNPDRLAGAVAAYEASLSARDRHLDPMGWATTQLNLGTALQTLGEIRLDRRLLDGAMAAYATTLEVWTRDRVPARWASTRSNMGFLHCTRFRLDRDPKDLDLAQAARDDARAVAEATGLAERLAKLDRLQARIDALRRR